MSSKIPQLPPFGDGKPRPISPPPPPPRPITSTLRIDSTTTAIDQIVRMAEEIALLNRINADMIAALKAAQEHVRELREAWMTGAISERDGRGGERSNRNVEIDCQLAAAIAKAEGRG